MKILTIITIILLLVACKPKPDYIIPIDTSKYVNEVKTRLKSHGLTQEELNEIAGQQIKDLQINTIGKTLPIVYLNKLNGPKIRLQDLIHELTLLNFTTSSCGPGIEGTTEFLPKALDILKKQNIKINTICIIVRDSSDIVNPHRITELIAECGKYYKNIYIMEEKESRQINVLGSPMRFLITQNHFVKSFDEGSAPPDNLAERIKNQINSQ